MSVSWTPELEDELRYLWADVSLTVEQVARALGATPKAVQAHRRKLGLPARAGGRPKAIGEKDEAGKTGFELVYVRAKRTCLSCLSDFDSEGAHNRICPSCKTSDTWRTLAGGIAI